MTALRTTRQVACIRRDILQVQEANLGHEWAGSIAYNVCISTSYIPLLFWRLNVKS